MENERKNGHNQDLSFQNHDNSFDFQKEPGASPLPPRCVPVKVSKYASIFLNIPKYP